MNLGKGVQSPSPLESFLAGADACVVADLVALNHLLLL